MRPEQERVKNLLSDTVTLLCKNGLTYKDELRVEAIIGITLDNNDVFIVHINDKFDCKGDKSSSGDLRSPVSKAEGFPKCENQPELINITEDGDHKLLDEIQGFNEVGNELEADKGSELNTPTTQGELSASLDHTDVVVKVEDGAMNMQDVWGDVPALKSPGSIAQQALMIAGQRRVLNPPPQKRPYGGSMIPTGAGQHDADAMRQTYSSFNLTTDISKNNGRLWDAEPPAKRQSLDDYYLIPTEQGEMSAQLLFDPNTSPLFSTDGSRAGCSSWSSGGTPSSRPTGLQSDMLRRSVSSEAKFPNFALVNYHAKEPLVRHIVEPVSNQGGLVLSFRLGWFGKAGEVLEDVWQQLVYLRSVVDAQVCDTPGVAFVLSALSGTVSQKAGFPRKTYPAVAYWIASQDQTFEEASILPRMHSLNLGSTVKQLHSTNNCDKQKMASSLFVVVKDNSESYVRRMADASATMCEGEKLLSDRHPIVKIYVKDVRYWSVLEEAKVKLEQVNFSFNLEKVF